MDLIKVLYDNKINNISLIALDEKLSSREYQLVAGTLFMEINKKTIPIKCIREYYLEPNKTTKMPKVNLANPCNKIKDTFGLTNCDSCIDCHRLMIDRTLTGKSKLYNK